MALRPCTECKREISSEAKSCPHCGKQNPTTKNYSIGQGCAGCLVVVIVLWVIGSLAGGPASSPSATQPERSRSGSCAADKCVVRAPTGAPQVPLAVSKAAFDEMLSAGSDQATAVMIMNGTVFLVPQNTSVSIVERTFTARKVLVTEGAALGRSGWLPYEWVVDR